MPVLTLDWDPDDYMPDTDHPWNATPCGGGAPVADTWSAWIRWETAGNVLALGDDSGVYVIEDGGAALYAGKALSFSNRFNARSRVFHEFGLEANVIPHVVVRTATVTSAPNPNLYGKVTLAEHWLIRFLYCRDFAHPPNQLQNISVTNWFTAPADGLSIRFDITVAPAYLHDAWAAGRAGWVAPVANIAGFDYAPNTPVLQ